MVNGGSVSEDDGLASVDLLANASDIDSDDLDVAGVSVASSNAGRVVAFAVDAETGALTLDPDQFRRSEPRRE